MPRNLIIAETVVITANTITIQNPALPHLRDGLGQGYCEMKGEHPRAVEVWLYNETDLWFLAREDAAPTSAWEALAFDLNLGGLPGGPILWRSANREKP